MIVDPHWMIADGVGPQERRPSALRVEPRTVRDGLRGADEHFVRSAIARLARTGARREQDADLVQPGRPADQGSLRPEPSPAPEAKPTIRLTALEEAQPREDLRRRMECKYLFPNGDVDAIRGVLRRFCRPISHAGPVSTVRSLYFDDPTLSSARANLDGVSRRRKVRLRWYDETLPADSIMLETKWRDGRVTGKHRLHLALEGSLATISFRRLRSELLRCAEAHPAGRHLALATDAVLLVEYRREHYLTHDAPAGDAPIRLTLDYGLRLVPQLGRLRLDERFAVPLPGMVLVELKCDEDGLRHASRILEPLRARQTRFSKYVTGCLQLGYLRDA